MRCTTTIRRLALPLLVAALAASCANSRPASTSAPLPAPTAAPTAAPARTRVARLDPDNLQAWSHYLAPQPSELAWESLPWLTSYSDGILAAQEQRRPLLLWVMNGHPLGCT